jgi:2-polyprenyl-3-methyl-5-hydroxy-6-metoxy-1,4-benzoquinol methylase
MKPAVAQGVSSPPTPAPSRTEALAAAWKAYYQRVGHEAPRHPAAKDFMDRDLAQALGRMIPNDASVLEVGCGAGDLLASLPNRVRVGVDLRPEAVAEARQRHPDLQFAVTEAPALAGEAIPDRFDAIVCDRLVHSVLDVRALLRGLGERLTPDGRMFLTAFNYLWEVPTRLAESLGWKVPAPTSNWLSASDFQNLFDMAGLEVVRFDDRLMLPLPIPGLDVALNRYLVKLPLMNLGSLYRIYVLRKRRGTARPARPGAIARDRQPTVTVVVPARNESGNVEQAVTRTPVMGGGTELIFVEGGSSDGTWERIQEVIAGYQGPLKLAAYKQSGKGKGDAVRLGFGKATGDLLMILDADLTVPPEDLPVFYESAVDGYADYLQGTRLVYPMEAGAMRFFNKLGNIAFSRLFTHLLQQPIKDTLCGTKVLWRRDYERIAANRHVFGDFDPFGDFDLIFGAARLNLKLGEIPVRYRDRVYGETNIQRWKHGWLLLKMSALAARKLRYV